MLDRLLAYFRSDLAVDLGTANTRVGVAGEGVIVDEPSVAAVDRATGRILLDGAAVGHLARQMEGRTPESLAVARPVRHGVVADFELCEAMLRRFFSKAQPPGVRLRPRVLAALPGAVTQVEHRAALATLRRAGAGRVWLMRKATAAALGAALPVGEPLAGMVCDIGAGTTEVAVLSLGQSVAMQSIRVGGDAMDQAIADYARRQHALRVGAAAAERLRVEIGSAFPLEEETAAELSGVDRFSGLPRRATITSEEVREALAEPLEAILDAIREAIDPLSPELASDLVEHGMVLCGGGALLRGIDQYLGEQTGLPVRLCPEPATAVVRGLLVALEQFDRWRPLVETGDDGP